MPGGRLPRIMMKFGRFLNRGYSGKSKLAILILRCGEAVWKLR
jgi:hypothetical protein